MRSELEEPPTTLDPANEPPLFQPHHTTAPSAPLASAFSPVTGHSNRPTLSPAVAHSHTAMGPHPFLSSHSNPATLLPLQEAPGGDGLVKVHVPFSLSELSQIEKQNKTK